MKKTPMTTMPSERPALAHYLRLDYPIEVVKDEDAWVASIPDLPGCMSYGQTVSDAVENVQKTKDLWIEGRYENDQIIPEPTDEDEFSGKFVLRIPRALHRSLAFEANKQGVSLNHYVSHLLSERHSIGHFQDVAKSLLDKVSVTRQQWSCRNWVVGRQHYGATVLMGNLPGNLEFLAYLRKPPVRCNYIARQQSLFNQKFLTE